MSDALRAEARGYAWFWVFLGSIGVAFAGVSWLMLRGKLGPID